MPAVYRQCAFAYTDFWVSYEKVITRKRHRAVGKETGQTNHFERLNNTLRQRIYRMVRKDSLCPKTWAIISGQFGTLYTTTMPN